MTLPINGNSEYTIEIKHKKNNYSLRKITPTYLPVLKKKKKDLFFWSKKEIGLRVTMI